MRPVPLPDRVARILLIPFKALSVQSICYLVDLCTRMVHSLRSDVWIVQEEPT